MYGLDDEGGPSFHYPMRIAAPGHMRGLRHKTEKPLGRSLAGLPQASQPSPGDPRLGADRADSWNHLLAKKHQKENLRSADYRL
jgi:hypothetical protein